MTLTTHQLPELPGRADMAALLQSSTGAIDLMRRRGDLPESFKLGKRRYWRRADVLAWLDTRCATPSPAVADTQAGGAA